jgi:hypothetical protein
MIENASYTHPAWRHIPKPIWEMLADDVCLFNTFVSRIERLGERIREGKQAYVSRKGKTDPANLGNEAVGDIWEAVMGEHFLHHFGKGFGLWDYEIATENDWGVDGKGKGNDGKLKTVQLKFRSDALKILTHRDGLDNFVEESIYKYGINPSEKSAVLIVTNADKVLWKDVGIRWNGLVSYITPNESWGLYHGKKYSSKEAVRTLSIRQLVDSTLPYWNSLRTVIASLP